LLQFRVCQHLEARESKREKREARRDELSSDRASENERGREEERKEGRDRRGSREERRGEKDMPTGPFSTKSSTNVLHSPQTPSNNAITSPATAGDIS
jgi:hypothetical protein